ncbi:MAG: AAA family ATPase, partial [Solirubrobacteraceae bacterium]
AAADLRRVHFFQMGSPYEPVPFRIPQDVEELARRIHQTNAALVVVDPLIEFIDGKTDAHKSQPVRQALAALNGLAREITVAIVVIVHLNKGASTDPLIRHEGSAAFTQVLRGAMLLGPDPNDPEGERGSRRVLAVSSSNLAQLAPSLLYQIRTATVLADTGEEIVTAEIACVGESDATGCDLLGSHESKKESSALDEAVEFLVAELADGPRPSVEVKEAAAQARISEKTLHRAKNKLEIRVSKAGYQGAWSWSLNDASKDGQAGLASFGNSP